MAEHVCGAGSHAVQGLHCTHNSATIACPGDSTCEEITSGETSLGVCCLTDQSATISMAGKEWNTHACVCLCMCACLHACVHMSVHMYK